MKIFISQPMKGKTDEEILADRERIESKCRFKYGPSVEFIDSFFEDFPDDVGNNKDPNRQAIKYLAESLKLLADADIAVFGDGWFYNRGCSTEFDVATNYGIPTIDEEDEL